MTLYTTRATVGIPSWTCHCGIHQFAYPYDEARVDWDALNRSMFKQKFIDQGVLSETPPATQPHVILISPIDVPLLSMRRWRVVKSPARKKARFEVRGRSRGKALQRLIYPDAEVIQLRNNNGADLRRENLRQTNMRDVCRAREESKRLPAVGRTAKLDDDFRPQHRQARSELSGSPLFTSCVVASDSVSAGTSRLALR